MPGKTQLVNRSLSGYSVMSVTREAGPGTDAPTAQPQMAGKPA